MLRLSSYAIVSEPLPGGGYSLLNGFTGAIDLISKEMAQFLLDALTQKDHREIYFDPDDIHAETREEFLERGHFTQLSHQEERAFLVQVTKMLHETEQKNVRFLVVPNLDCNYRCTYCFEKQLQEKFNPQNKSTGPKAVLDSNQIESIYNCIGKLRSEAGQTGPLQIILYGGEPLDKDNKDIVFELVRKGEEKGINFAAITNGHDLDVFLPLFGPGPGKINQVQVTFDGPPDFHDKRRLPKTGEPSFHRLKKNVHSLLALEGVQVQLRVHADRSSVQYFGELLDIFENEGWLNNEKIVVYTSTIYSKDKSGEVSAAIENDKIENYLLDIAASYKNVIIGAPSANIREILGRALKKSQPYRLRSNFCGANTGMYIFAPDGHIYACWESLGKECSRIGSFSAPGNLEFNQEMKEKWFNRSVANIPECLECSYCLICAGGCVQYAYYNTGSMERPFCDNFYKIFPYALAKGVDNFLNFRDDPEKTEYDKKGEDFCL